MCSELSLRASTGSEIKNENHLHGVLAVWTASIMWKEPTGIHRHRILNLNPNVARTCGKKAPMSALSGCRTDNTDIGAFFPARIRGKRVEKRYEAGEDGEGENGEL